MRASSYAASSNPTVKSTHFPPGSRSGQRCEDSPRALSSVVSGVGLPPLPETRESPAVCGAAKTMVPSGAHTHTARIVANVRHQQYRTAGQPALSRACGSRRNRSTPRRRRKRAGVRLRYLSGRAPQDRSARGRTAAAFHPRWLRTRRGTRPASMANGAESSLARASRAGNSRLKRAGRFGGTVRGERHNTKAPSAAMTAIAIAIGARRATTERAGARCGCRRLVLLDQVEARIAHVLEAYARIATQTAAKQPSDVSRHRRREGRSSRGRHAARRRRPRTPTARRTPGVRSASRRARTRMPTHRCACPRPRPSPARDSCSARCRGRHRAR